MIVDLSRKEWKALVGVLKMEKDLLNKGILQCGSDSVKREWIKDSEELQSRLQEALGRKNHDNPQPNGKSMTLEKCPYCQNEFSGNEEDDEDHIEACVSKHDLKNRADSIGIAIKIVEREESKDLSVSAMRFLMEQYLQEARHK